jgi:hypothetical protein
MTNDQRDKRANDENNDWNKCCQTFTGLNVSLTRKLTIEQQKYS